MGNLVKHAQAALLVVACAAADAQTVFKCTAPGGQVTMQQTPCASTSTGSAKVYSGASGSRPNSVSAGSGLPSAGPRRQWIVWTGNPARDAALAVANLEAIRMLGEGCEERLRLRSTVLDDCSSFLEQFAPGGDFGRIGDKLKDLAADRSTAQQVEPTDFRRAAMLSGSIERLRDFVQVAAPRR